MAKRTSKSGQLKLIALVACDAAIRDPNSQKVTLYGIFDKMFVEKFPALVGFSVYAKLGSGRGKQSVQIEVLEPNNKPVGGKPPSIDIKFPPEGRAQIIIQVGVGDIKKAGAFKVRVKCNGKIVGDPLVIWIEKQKQRANGARKT